MSNISPVSFKAYIPVRYMAKNPNNDKYVPVLKNENIRKCQSFVVRNLNGTAKNNRDEGFVSFYKSYDRDYRKFPVVHSVYDINNPVVYMVTGEDTDTIRELAKPVGKAKAEALDKLGSSKSYESQYEAKNYIKNVKRFLKNHCARVKDENGEPLTLTVYYNPKYTRDGNLKCFEFAEAEFIVDNQTIPL